MAIFTFSTKTSRPADEQLVLRIKKLCEDKGYNFSSIIVTQLRKWEAEVAKERTNDRN